MGKKKRSDVFSRLRDFLVKRKEIIAFILLFGFTLFYVNESFSCDNLYNSDSAWHFHAANKITEDFRFPFNTIGWVDDLGGFPFAQYYSPLFFNLFSIMHFIIPFISIFKLWTFFLFLIVFFISYTSYLLGKRLGLGYFTNLLLGICVIGWRKAYLDDMSPMVLYNIGLLPFIFSFIAFMLYLNFLFKTLKDPSRNNIVGLSIMLGLLLMSHVYSFVVAGVFSGLIIIIYFIRDIVKEDRIKTIKRYLSYALIPVLIFLIFAFWTIPLTATLDYTIHPDAKFDLQEDYIGKFFSPKENTLDSTLIVSIGKEYQSFLFYLGFLGILGLFFKKTRTATIYIICFLASVFVINKGIFNLVRLPIVGSIAYIHLYGRGMAFFKVGWIILAMVPIALLTNLLKLRFRKNNIGKKTMITLLIIIIFGLITASQINLKSEWPNTYRCMDSKEREDFRAPFSGIDETKEIGELLKLKNGGNILLDPYTNHPEEMINIPLYSKKGSVFNWPTGFSHQTLRQPAYYIIDEFINYKRSSVLNLLMDDMNIDFMVFKKSTIEKDSELINSLDNYEETYTGEFYSVFEAKEKTQNIEFPERTYIIIDDNLFYKDDHFLREISFLKAYYNNSNMYLILRSGDDLSELLPYVNGIILGDISCEKEQQYLDIQDTNIYRLRERNNCTETEIKTINIQDSFFFNDTVIENQYTRMAYIKTSFFPSISFYQDNKKLKKYLAAPTHVGVIANKCFEIEERKERTGYELIGMIISLVVILFLVFGFRRNYDKDDKKNKIRKVSNISIVIPAYNEEKRLPKSISMINSYIKKRNIRDYEIIIVDDCSSDGTPELIRRLKQKNKKIRSLRNKINKGKGYSVRRGMLNAKKKFVLFTDSDLSTPIEELNKFFSAMDKYDIIVASRNLEDSDIRVKQPLFRQLLGNLFPLVVRTMLRFRIRDTQCGFKLFKKESAQKVFRSSRLDGWAFDAEVLYIAKKKGLKIKEMPVVWIDSDGSKVNPMKDGFRMLFDIFRILINDIGGKYK